MFMSVPNKKFSENYESVFGKKDDKKEKLKEQLRQKLLYKNVDAPKPNIWKRFMKAIGLSKG